MLFDLGCANHNKVLMPHVPVRRDKVTDKAGVPLPIQKGSLLPYPRGIKIHEKQCPPMSGPMWILHLGPMAKGAERESFQEWGQKLSLPRILQPQCSTLDHLAILKYSYELCHCTGCHEANQLHPSQAQHSSLREDGILTLHCGGENLFWYTSRRQNCYWGGELRIKVQELFFSSSRNTFSYVTPDEEILPGWTVMWIES